MSPITFSAVRGPTPSTSKRTRFHATASRGFSRIRRYATMSLMCDVSMNLNPPNLTNGMFALFSSISRSKERYPERKRTAMVCRGTPCSRSSRTFWTTNFDCRFSLWVTTIDGRSPPGVRVKSSFAYLCLMVRSSPSTLTKSFICLAPPLCRQAFLSRSARSRI